MHSELRPVQVISGHGWHAALVTFDFGKSPDLLEEPLVSWDRISLVELVGD